MRLRTPIALAVGTAAFGLLVGLFANSAAVQSAPPGLPCPVQLPDNTNAISPGSTTLLRPFQQNVLVFGRVTDANQQGLTDVFVQTFVNGQATGSNTVTQRDGCFVFKVPTAVALVDQSVSFEFSALGYSNQRLDNQPVPNPTWTSDSSRIRLPLPPVTLAAEPPPVPPPGAPPTPPGPPLDVVAKAGWQKVTVDWDPPANQGTYPVMNYRVQASPGASVCLSRSTDEKLTQCTFTGLDPGTPYTFTVQGLSGGGWGAQSAPSNAATPYELKITASDRKKLTFRRVSLGSEVSARGAAFGYPAGTRITVFVREGDSGQWVEQKRSTLTSDATGNFSWKRKFSKSKDGTAISVQFAIGADRSNPVRLPPVS